MVDPVAVVIAVLVVGVLLAGILGVPFRALIGLQGYYMGARLHWNTKITMLSQLYSLYPRNFVTFWAVAGVSLGTVTGGTAGILFAPKRQEICSVLDQISRDMEARP